MSRFITHREHVPPCGLLRSRGDWRSGRGPAYAVPLAYLDLDVLSRLARARIHDWRTLWRQVVELISLSLQKPTYTAGTYFQFEVSERTSDPFQSARHKPPAEDVGESMMCENEVCERMMCVCVSDVCAGGWENRREEKGGRSEYSTKNKTPTRQCGEQTAENILEISYLSQFCRVLVAVENCLPKLGPKFSQNRRLFHLLHGRHLFPLQLGSSLLHGLDSFQGLAIAWEKVHFFKGYV